MDTFKVELKALLSKYPQVKSVSFDVTETMTSSTQLPGTVSTTTLIPITPSTPMFHAASPTAAVDAVLAGFNKLK